MPDRAAVFRGYVQNGRLKLDERESFARLVQSLEGKEIKISLKRYRRKNTDAQRGYYWAVVLEEFAEHVGENKNDLHESLKRHFLSKHPEEHPGPLVFVGSTADLDTLQFSEYLENVIRLAAEYGCPISPPV